MSGERDRPERVAPRQWLRDVAPADLRVDRDVRRQVFTENGPALSVPVTRWVDPDELEEKLEGYAELNEEQDALPADGGEFYGWAPYDDDLDDRPLWQIELGISDADLDPGDPVPEVVAPTPEAPAPCTHCHDKPIKYRGKGLCSRCNEYQRTRGQLPPPRLTVGRRR